MGFAPHAHVYMPQMESRYSKSRALDIRDPTSAASPYLAIPQTQSKAAFRPSSYMGTHTKNEIYPLGGRHAALEAGAWSYGRRGSGIGWQEKASPLVSGPQMKPHNRQRRTRGRS